MTVLKNNRGQGMTEYLVLLMLVAVGSIVVIGELGTAIRGRVTEARKQIDKLSVSAEAASDKGGSSGGGSGALSTIVNGALGALSGNN